MIEVSVFGYVCACVRVCVCAKTAPSTRPSKNGSEWIGCSGCGCCYATTARSLGICDSRPGEQFTVQSGGASIAVVCDEGEEGEVML